MTGQNFTTVSTKMKNTNFHVHICIQNEKCIQISTNKPSLCSVVLVIAPQILRQNDQVSTLSLTFTLNNFARKGKYIFSGNV